MTRHAATLIAVAGLVTAAGCGQAARPAVSVGSPTSPTSSTSATSSTPPASSLNCRAATTITEADSGRVYCLARSMRLEVYLHGTAQDRWPPIRLEGEALRRAASGKGMLALGVTGGFFVADHAGTARLTATRHPCDRRAPVGNCRAPRAFEITVVVQ